MRLGPPCLGKLVPRLAGRFPDREQPSLYPIEGGNAEKLMAKLTAARECWAKVSGAVPVITLCYEVGHDAFWLARFLKARRVECLVIDLNAQLDDWLATVANVRLHGTTQRIVAEAFAAEQLELQRLPAVPFDALLKLERLSAMMAWYRSAATTTASPTAPACRRGASAPRLNSHLGPGRTVLSHELLTVPIRLAM